MADAIRYPSCSSNLSLHLIHIICIESDHKLKQHTLLSHLPSNIDHHIPHKLLLLHSSNIHTTSISSAENRHDETDHIQNAPAAVMQMQINNSKSSSIIHPSPPLPFTPPTSHKSRFSTHKPCNCSWNIHYSICAFFSIDIDWNEPGTSGSGPRPRDVYRLTCQAKVKSISSRNQ